MLGSLELIEGSTLLDLNMIQLFCTVITICFFLTGVLTSQKIFKQNSVKNVNFLPYVLTSLNCLLWTSYGKKIEDSTLVLVNATGAFLQFVYILVYLKYLNSYQQVKKHLKQLFGAGLVFGLVHLYLKFGMDSTRRVQSLGLICDFVTILMFASPLSTLRTVIKTKSTVTISLPLSVMVFFVSISWFSYGLLKSDFYIKIPNAIGAVLGIIQISLFCIYPFDNPKTSNL